MVEKPLALETIFSQYPPKREIFQGNKKGEKYGIESMVSRRRVGEKDKGVIVYVVPGSTRYIGTAPAGVKSEGV